jgi:hypothetical protein
MRSSRPSSPASTLDCAGHAASRKQVHGLRRLLEATLGLRFDAIAGGAQRLTEETLLSARRTYPDLKLRQPLLRGHVLPAAIWPRRLLPLALVMLFGYDSARHALPCPGSSGPRDPRESPGDHPDVLSGASSRLRICLRRSSRGSRGLRPETPRARGLSDSVWRHLWFGRARDGAAADLGPVESVRPGSPPCFVSATPDETVAPLAAALVRAGRSGSGRGSALPNGPASGSVTPLLDRRTFMAGMTGGLLAAPLAADRRRW